MSTGKITYNLKHLFYWIFVGCLVLAAIRVPLVYTIKNFPYYYFFQPFWIFYGWLLGYSPTIYEPTTAGECFATIFGGCATVFVSISLGIIVTGFICQFRPK